MNPDTAHKLIQLNHQFYQTFALQFSTSRQRLQPGILRILEAGFLADPGGIPLDADILELGCGNGTLARELARRGLAGAYLGLDFNAELLEEASHNLPEGFQGDFRQINLASPDWEESISIGSWDVILAFAVLHHLPGKALRKHLLHTIRRLIKPGGSFIHSEWQFLNSPRLVQRIQPWETIDLRAADVDPGDYLMDWRSGGHGLRYVHLFSEHELEELAGEAGFQVIETFLSDGEGGSLGLYQLWKLSQ